MYGQKCTDNLGIPFAEKYSTYKYVLGWSKTYSGLSKVQIYMVYVNFPIYLDPRSSPSEKFSKIFEIYYWCKPVEVLPSKLLSSDFGQSECGSKNP